MYTCYNWPPPRKKILYTDILVEWRRLPVVLSKSLALELLKPTKNGKKVLQTYLLHKQLLIFLTLPSGLDEGGCVAHSLGLMLPLINPHWNSVDIPWQTHCSELVVKLCLWSGCRTPSGGRLVPFFIYLSTTEPKWMSANTPNLAYSWMILKAFLFCSVTTVLWLL